MTRSILFFILLQFSFFTYAQNIITLPSKTSDKVTWKTSEREYYSNIWQTQVVTNVAVPTLQVFKPTEETRNGTVVIIAPGGGLYAQSIESEGRDVAKWLAKKGITAFVLKYRLVPTGKDGVAEITKLGNTNPKKIYEEVSKVMSLSVADALNAVSYVRKHAGEFGIAPEKIGLMGFSAGGAVTMGAAYTYAKENKPNFLVPVYAWTTAMPVQKPKKDAPPMLVICASDDPLGLASGSIELYNSWHNQGLKVGLHMYSKGGHGFGMRKNGLPSDNWIERFYDWSVSEGLTAQRK
ncbi:MAG: alpha/beta hydrolase [Bacteroidota bacterium]